MLLLRNPQETLHLERVLNIEQIHITRQLLENEKREFKTYKNAEYITHVDRLVKAEANFINLYTPLFVTNRDLYYVSSRNLISIEIAPVDPGGFVYNTVTEEGECVLDKAATTWAPYFNDDLINNAFLGAFTLSRMTNWNILRPVTGFSSDLVIERAIESEKTKPEYKLFDLRRPKDIPDQKGQSEEGKILISSWIAKCIDRTKKREEMRGHRKPNRRGGRDSLVGNG